MSFKISFKLNESNIVSTPALTSNTSAFAITKQLKIQSNIIEQKHIELIAKWINEVSNLDQNTFYTINLLQRASKHGSTSKVFHKRCDSKGPTIVIMRVKNTGEILGGYNPIHWGDSTSTNKNKKTYNTASTSFIFSLNLRNINNSIVSKVVNTNYAIYQNNYICPAFGRNDLKICGSKNFLWYKSTLISIINNGKGSERMENQGYLDKRGCYRLGKQKIDPNFKAVEFKKFNDHYFNFYDARSIKGALDSLLNIVTPKTNVL
ncbi:17722_t:CDS:2 [Gigaspora rosea]|nr:17722_t:CDS:2 [Gigaspora rosea]